jgi:DNA-binding transcriptional regulator LsrR (DeoR family)
MSGNFCFKREHWEIWWVNIVSENENVIDTPLHRRTVAIPLEDIAICPMSGIAMKKKKRINKVEAILGSYEVVY